MSPIGRGSGASQLAAWWLSTYATRMGPLDLRLLGQCFGMAAGLSAVTDAAQDNPRPQLPATADELRSHRENRRLLPGVTIPESIEITADFDQAIAAADLCVGGVPTVHMRSALAPLAGRYPTAIPWLSLAKGVALPVSASASQCEQLFPAA